MKDKLSAFVMWAFAIPVTWSGIDTVFRGATTIIGLLTAMLGFGIGLCGLLWWFRRLARQGIKIEIEKKTLKKLNEETETET